MTQGRPSAIALMGVVALLSATGEPSQADSVVPASSKPSETVKIYLAHMARIESLDVVYTATERHDDEVVPPADGYVKWRLAVKGQRRYMEVTHVNSAVGADDDPLHGISIFDGVSFNAAYPLERVYETSVRNALPVYTIKVRGNPIQECLGWWPLSDSSKPPEFDGQPFFVQTLAQLQRSTDRTGTEVINGRSCRIADFSDIDALWIDARTGNLIRRVHYFDKSRRFAMEYDLEDFKPVNGDLELPYRLIRRYVQVNPRVVRSENVYSVMKYKINNVSDSIFQYVTPPGTLIHDRDTDQTSQASGGLDLLDIVVDRVRRYVPASPSSKKTELRGWLPPAFGVLSACTLILIFSAMARLTTHKPLAQVALHGSSTP